MVAQNFNLFINKKNCLHLFKQNVPVLSETALLAVIINRQRPFLFTHGDVVHTPDVLGQRFGKFKRYNSRENFLYNESKYTSQKKKRYVPMYFQ